MHISICGRFVANVIVPHPDETLIKITKDIVYFVLVFVSIQSRKKVYNININHVRIRTTITVFRFDRK